MWDAIPDSRHFDCPLPAFIRELSSMRDQKNNKAASILERNVQAHMKRVYAAMSKTDDSMTPGFSPSHAPALQPTTHFKSSSSRLPYPAAPGLPTHLKPIQVGSIGQSHWHALLRGSQRERRQSPFGFKHLAFPSEVSTARGVCEGWWEIMI